MDTRTNVMVPRPVSAGPEMEALGRFYRDVTWKGVIHAGGMGPGTPAMTGIGHSTSQVIQDGRWIVVDSEQDQFLEDGTFVLKWQLHWVSGWDPEHGEYRAAILESRALAAAGDAQAAAPVTSRAWVRPFETGA
jgi:hypothetical protein